MLRKASVVLSGTLSRLVLSAVTGLVIAQLIGPQTRGALSVVMTAAALVSVFLGAGLQGSTTFMLAAHRWEARDAVLVASAAASVTFGFSILTLGFASQRFDIFGSLTSIPVWTVALGGALLLLTSLLGSALTGLQLYSKGAITAVSAPIMNFLIFVLLISLGVTGGRSAVVSWLAGLAMAGTLSAFFLMNRDPQPFRWPPDLRFAFGYGARTFLGNLLNYANLRLDVFLLASLGTLTATGLYSVSVSVSETLWAVPMAIGTVVFPEIASRSRDDNGIWTARVCRMTTLVTAILAIGAGMAGSILFGVVMKHYAGALIPLLLLLPGTLGMAVAKVLGNDMYGRSLPEWHAYAALIGLVATVAGDFIAIPIYGAAGAAGVSSVSYVLYAAVILIGFRRECSLPLSDLLLPTKSDAYSLVSAVRRIVQRRTVEQG